MHTFSNMEWAGYGGPRVEALNANVMRCSMEKLEAKVRRTRE